MFYFYFFAYFNFLDTDGDENNKQERFATIQIMACVFVNLIKFFSCISNWKQLITPAAIPGCGVPGGWQISPKTFALSSRLVISTP